MVTSLRLLAGMSGMSLSCLKRTVVSPGLSPRAQNLHADLGLGKRLVLKQWPDVFGKTGACGGDIEQQNDRDKSCADVFHP